MSTEIHENTIVSTEIQRQVLACRHFFASGRTRDAAFRQEQLTRLYDAIGAFQTEIEAALKKDLNKSPYESYMTEIGLVLEEIRFIRRRLGRWMKPQRVRASLSQMPASVRIHPEPYGVVLIMSPWNYPFQLTLLPLVCALAAGNCAIIKPSSYSAATSAVIRRLIEKTFDPGLVSVVEGGRKENQSLLEESFDYIFFTGSPAVGRSVMAAAAKNVTPVTLELGGKSPVIVDASADLKLAAKRIAFGKFTNSGQTCVAPDYVYVHQSIRPAFTEALCAEFRKISADPAYFQEVFPCIINTQHFERLKGLLKQQTILCGGQVYEERRQMEPTVVDCRDWMNPLMQEEIFGPVLPLLSFEDLDELLSFLQTQPRPLAVYHFTRDPRAEALVRSTLSFGGGCVNDCLLHIISPYAPFGGVGNSGLGHYHGKFGFDEFSHHKTVLKKPAWLDLSVRYHPFKAKDLALIKKVMR